MLSIFGLYDSIAALRYVVNVIFGRIKMTIGIMPVIICNYNASIPDITIIVTTVVLFCVIVSKIITNITCNSRSSTYWWFNRTILISLLHRYLMFLIVRLAHTTQNRFVNVCNVYTRFYKWLLVLLLISHWQLLLIQFCLFHICTCLQHLSLCRLNLFSWQFLLYSVIVVFIVFIRKIVAHIWLIWSYNYLTFGAIEKYCIWYCLCSTRTLEVVRHDYSFTLWPGS